MNRASDAALAAALAERAGTALLELRRTTTLTGAALKDEGDREPASNEAGRD